MDGGSNGSVQLWDVRCADAAACVARLVGSGVDGVRAVCLSGNCLISAPSPCPHVSVWDLRVQRVVTKLRAHTNNDALALDPFSGRIACGGRMNELRVWHTRG